MQIIIYILAAVVLLGLCIFVHEMGHLLGGKMVGIKARVFSMGYGKGIFKKKWGDTTYQITAIPFGGYCSFYGEDPTEKRENKEYEFLTASPWRRIVTVIMGPLFNLFFGIIIFFIMNLVGFQSETNQILIPEAFQTGKYVSPAVKSGLKTGDKIIEIDGDKIYSFSDIQSKVVFSEGKSLKVKVDRNGEQKVFPVTPSKITEKSHYSIGILAYGTKVLVTNVVPGEIAEKVGLEKLDEIQAIDNIEITSQKQFVDYIRGKSNKKIKLSILRAGKKIEISLTPRFKEILKIKEFKDNKYKQEIDELSAENFALIKTAIKNKKVKIAGKLVNNFDSFKSTLAKFSGKKTSIETPGGTYTGIISYENFGFIGIGTQNAPEMIDVKFGLGKAFVKSFTDPFDFIVMNLKGMGMLFTGKLDVRKNLSGPIRIAQIAGDTAYYRGIAAFIILMAKISIILMVMNLLPIPAVDGSYIIFFLYEAIRGRPIQEKIMEKIQLVGFAILIGLMGFVLFNDIAMLPAIQKLFN